MTTAAALRTIAQTTDTAIAPLAMEAAKQRGYLMGHRKSAERTRYTTSREHHLEQAAKAEAKLAEIEAEMAPLNAIAKAGNWARFYFVPGGHVHRAYCSTLRDTTTTYWIPEHAGASDQEIIDAAGHRACTVCFADAPIDPTRKPSISYIVKEEAQREAEAAAKEAKRKAAADAAIRDQDGNIAYKSRRAAENALSRDIDSLVYFASYSKGYTDRFTGDFVPNKETPEEYWAEREERLIAHTRRTIRGMIELLELNLPAEEVKAFADKKFAQKVKEAMKLDLVLPENFSY